MGIITTMRRQRCVYWAADGCDEFGKTKYCSPCELPCRFQRGSVEFIDDSGVTLFGVATVFPDRETPPGGYLLEGRIKDVVVDVSNPLKNPGAIEIVENKVIPNLKNTEVLYTAICDDPNKRG